MVFSMTDEVYVFLYSALSGGLIMLFYDILSIAGKKKECPVFLLNVCDGIFIIVACAIMVFVNFTVSNGIVRSFEFLGAILGAILYKLTLSRLISAFLKKITDAIAAFFKLFFKILLTPLAIMYKMINKCIVALFRPVVYVFRKLFSHLSFKMHTSIRTARKAIKKT
ncbi:MAG TPA: hypothetical protein DD391_00515 [Clostridiales bacterium]|nr:hypothetical protein [Clostridiales bacterium]HBL81089.1 hypothetical protein [Clostridiales bacterium]